MSKRTPLETCVRDTLEQYFKDLRGTEPHSMHEMVMHAVERPLLDVVMQHAEGNQSKAAEWLGINRNTLRRKLLDHKLIKP
ncbi:Fis family transcriptional regulator [Azohydromonas sp.]|uniref:Fis family transcriptional regulator n=1 Tax=Azohydromonas sp. TaxID=1872666 RepID=UPI002CBDF56F|nr:Fis family transcriptional regulator [Azohydromonas sp.]HMM84275.1 Fis family transcriptional regulator [Azohydromonas sp.]